MMDIGTMQHRILKIALGFLVQNNGVNFLHVRIFEILVLLQT